MRITGSALVITRLSRVAMNIGSEMATTASQIGARAGRRRGGRTGGCGSTATRRRGGGGHLDSKKALNDYLAQDSK